MGMRRIAVVASASGNGKTTLGRALAEQLQVPFVELDALVHGPNWVETSNDELRRQLAPILAGEGWVCDGVYESKLGELVLCSADTVVWLDLDMHVWLPRLIRRTLRRIRSAEVLWNGNRESLRGVLWGWNALFAWAFRTHFRRRRLWPHELARYRVVRLRTPQAVEHFLVTAE